MSAKKRKNRKRNNVGCFIGILHVILLMVVFYICKPPLNIHSKDFWTTWFFVLILNCIVSVPLLGYYYTHGKKMGILYKVLIGCIIVFVVGGCLYDGISGS